MSIYIRPIGSDVAYLYTEPTNLLTMPLEILHQICSNLEPIWLLNLTATCTTMLTAMSFENGNKVWYNVLPPSMWKDGEQFQNDAELRRALALQRQRAQLAQDVGMQRLLFAERYFKSLSLWLSC